MDSSHHHMIGAYSDLASLTAVDLNPLYSTATWVFALVLGALLIIDSRARCGDLSCSGLETLYLPAYALAASADWLQGPYVYALYAALGFDRTDISILFVVGFGSSMVAGPFVGALADRFGRKMMILTLYCGMYSLACVTKHFDLYWALMIGRLLGGVATSVLFSCFESWAVAEHARLGLRPAALKQLLTYQYFINGLSGCTMGLLAQVVVDSMPVQPLMGLVNEPSSWSSNFFWQHLYVGGETLSFDLSAGCLLLAALLICATWKEQIWHDHASTAEGGRSASMIDAIKLLGTAPGLLTIMTVASCTEAAMYAFVIEWTPALTVGDASPPHGLVFSSFMIAYMAGSTIFGMLSTHLEPPATLILFVTLGFTAVAATYALFAAGYGTTYQGSFYVFLLLSLFELALGGYMAAIASIKAKWVPSEVRATVYNLFRVPLNLLVIGINVTSLSSEHTFLACTLLLAIALAGAIAMRHQSLPIKEAPLL